MINAFDIDVLRRRIAAQERLAPSPRPPVFLGPAALDGVLPARGLETGALHEVVPAGHGDRAAAIGFAVCLLSRLAGSRAGPVLWAEPAHHMAGEGRLYPLGLAALGFDPDRLIALQAPKPVDILWALEEGLAHAPLCAVVGILPDRAQAYDFVASRRLALRAARQGVTALIVRAQSGLFHSTAAETRWSVAALPSRPRAGSRSGPGAPCWRLELVKSRKGITARGNAGFDIEWDHETLSFRVPAPLADRAPARAGGARRGAWAEAS